METESAAFQAEMSDEASADDNSFIQAEDESIYDVPPSHSRDVSETGSEDDVFNPGFEGPPNPPVLPPKKKMVRESIDDRLGIVTRLAEANPQRPVPVPRRSVIPKKPVPRPRIKRKSQMSIESPGSEENPARDATQGDSDVTQGAVQCKMESSVVDREGDDSQLSPWAEAEEQNSNEEPISAELNSREEPISVEQNSAVYDDVYVKPDDIVYDSNGEITIVKSNKGSVTSGDDDASGDECRGDYIDMSDELLASIGGGDTYPGPVEDRVVIGAETTEENDHRSSGSQSSECIYGQVWVMNSGKTKSVRQSSDVSLMLHPQTRQSVVSFCAPPPSYAPPPLPQGVMVLPELPNHAPPCVPPRPVGYKPPPQTTTWGAAEARPDSAAFNKFISERIVESEKQTELVDTSSSQGSDTDTPPQKPKRKLLLLSRESSPFREVMREREGDQEDGRPKPPPRVPNPFQSMYDPISRTYSFDNDLISGVVLSTCVTVIRHHSPVFKVLTLIVKSGN